MFELLKLAVTAKLNQTKLEKNITFINPEGIRLGAHCLIESYCTIKGSQSKLFGLEIGDFVQIKRFSRLSAPHSKIVIQDYSYVGYGSWIGGRGNIFIGKNSMVSINTVIVSSNHDYQNITIPYIDGVEKAEDIYIGDNVWIGSNCVILPGATIGDGAVIGAGAVVSSNIEPHTLATGVPARGKKNIDAQQFFTSGD